MNESDLISKLYEELSYQHSMYKWTTGILITIILAVLGFYTFQQWKFSHSGIKKMSKKLKKKFKIEETGKNINTINERLQDTKDLLADTKKKYLEIEKKNFETSLELSLNIISVTNSNSNHIEVSNKILLLYNVVLNNKNCELSETSMTSVWIYFYNMMNALSSFDFKEEKKKARDNTNLTFNLLSAQTNSKDKQDARKKSLDILKNWGYK
ncbi:hypothetical protein [Apilactobacillus timberlakei]|uniref:hypothetical protein n=1 Tax=Apilactobacillus timberlakei TaxID=2008380 RepID=UPI001126412D|nr:hypothetical protein [Apilactobacillus timberlakei]TPR12156.1 hypothetical protein DYZ97_07630 [Apilactobacillus timberlakei]